MDNFVTRLPIFMNDGLFCSRKSKLFFKLEIFHPYFFHKKFKFLNFKRL